MSAVLLTSDLMCSSQVSAAAARAGVPLTTAMSVTSLLEQAPGKRLAVLDLHLPGLDIGGVVSQLRELAPGMRIVAFGAHVQESLLQAADQAGCDTVLTRGQFHKQTEEVLRWAL